MRRSSSRRAVSSPTSSSSQLMPRSSLVSHVLRLSIVTLCLLLSLTISCLITLSTWTQRSSSHLSIDEFREWLEAQSTQMNHHRTGRTVLERPAARSTHLPMSEIAGSFSTQNLTCTAPFVPIYDRIVDRSNATTYIGNIPRTLHLSMESRCLHELSAIGIQMWKDALPNHDVYFHDDAAVDRLLAQDWPEFPNLSRIMKCVKFKGAMKIDIWRLLIVYRYGGMYADIDTWPGTDFTQDTIRDDDQAFFLSDDTRRPSQWLFAMEPRHPIAYYTILEVLSRILTLQNLNSPKLIYTTGPDALKTGYGYVLGSNWYMNKIYQKEGTFKGKFNTTARKLLDSMKTLDLVTGNSENIVAWNATTNVTVKEKLELETGNLHWMTQINNGVEIERNGGSCMDVMYEMQLVEYDKAERQE